MLSNDMSSLYTKCFICSHTDHLPNQCYHITYEPNRLNLLFRDNFVIPYMKRLSRAKMNSRASQNCVIRNQNKFLFDNEKKISYEAPFLSSKDHITYQRTSNFDKLSSINHKMTNQFLSSSSRKNDILLLNCMNSPFGLKSNHKNFNFKEIVESLEKSSNISTSKNFRDSGESNRVYFENSIGNEDILSPLEQESVRPGISGKRSSRTSNPIKLETIPTSNLIEECGSKNSINSNSCKEKGEGSKPFSNNSMTNPLNSMSNLEINSRASSKHQIGIRESTKNLRTSSYGSRSKGNKSNSYVGADALYYTIQVIKIRFIFFLEINKFLNMFKKNQINLLC